MDFTPVDPRTIPEGARPTRVSAPLCTAFMDSNEIMVVLDTSDETTQSMQTLRVALTAYIKSHDLPIRVFQKHSNLYLTRTDMEMDEDGTVHMIEKEAAL